jgi:hypothetical protein
MRAPDHAAVLYSLVRQEGVRHTKIVVSDRPLPNLPHAPDAPITSAKPVKQAQSDNAEDAFAMAELPVRPPHVHAAGGHAEEPSARHPRIIWTTDEARVPREREAWLRSLDRKYGITR